MGHSLVALGLPGTPWRHGQSRTMRVTATIILSTGKQLRAHRGRCLVDRFPKAVVRGIGAVDASCWRFVVEREWWGCMSWAKAWAAWLRQTQCCSGRKCSGAVWVLGERSDSVEPESTRRVRGCAPKPFAAHSGPGGFASGFMAHPQPSIGCKNSTPRNKG